MPSGTAIALKRVDLDDIIAERSLDTQLKSIHPNPMQAHGLLHGGVAAIYRGRKPQQLGDLAIVRFNRAVVMRRPGRKTGGYCFVADDSREPVYYVTPDARVERLGVITHIVNTF